MRVMVALPLRGEISPATRETLTTTCATLRERDIPVGVYTSEGGSIELARAELLSIFRRSDATHLLMVDADMSFAPEVPLAMLAAEVDVAFVAYRRRQAPHDFLVTRLAQPEAIEAHGGHRTLRVFGGGLGLTMVTRTLVETVAAKHPELEYERGGFVHCGLFLPTIQPDESGVRSFFGEDHSFFARVRAAGFSVYALIDALVTHDGHTGRFADEIITEETMAHAELLERSVTNELSRMCRADLPSGSCSICLANEGPHTLEEIAVHFKCTRENIRLIEEKALEKVRKRLLWVSRSSGRSRDEP